MVLLGKKRGRLKDPSKVEHSKKRKRIPSSPASRSIIINYDLCNCCAKPGELVCCDFCPRAYHSRCIPSLRKRGLPLGKWKCPQCYIDSPKNNRHVLKEVTDFESECAYRRLHSTTGIIQSEVYPESSVLDLPNIPSIMNLIQYIELIVAPDVFILVFKLTVNFLRTSSHTSNSKPTINNTVYYMSLAKIIGEQTLLTALWEIWRPGKSTGKGGVASAVIRGFGVQSSTKCKKCGTRIVLHNGCLGCGQMFVQAYHNSGNVMWSSYKLYIGVKPMSKIKAKWTKLYESYKCEVYLRESNYFKWDQAIMKMFNDDCIEACMRGVDYLCTVCSAERWIPCNVSNQLFLLHKLWRISCASAPKCIDLQNKLKHICHTLADQWTNVYKQLSDYCPAGESMQRIIQKALETLHICRRLGIYEKNTLTATSTEDTSHNEKQCTEIENNCDTIHEPKTNIESRPSRKAAQRCSNVLKSITLFETSKASFQFSYQRIKEEVIRMLSHEILLEEFIGTNLDSIPMTPPNFCGHCGEDKLNSCRILNHGERRRCSNCSMIIRPCVDFGALTDAVVWLYVCEDIGIPMKCQDGMCTMSDFLHMLPLVRKYSGLDELGQLNFKLQCYFVTHFLYVISDWGSHQLPRLQFTPEFELIISSLSLCMDVLDDAEIVGEFLHCLRILGVCQESDPLLMPLMNGAMTYLLNFEKRKGKRGLWVKVHRTDAYDKYHAAYTGIVGLLTGLPPLPHKQLDDKSVSNYEKYRGFDGRPTSCLHKTVSSPKEVIRVTSAIYVSPCIENNN